MNLLGAFCVVLVSALPAEASSGLTLKDISAAARAARQSLRSIDVTYEYRARADGGSWHRSFVPHMRERIRYDIESGNYAKYSQLPERDGRLVENVETLVGINKTTYDPRIPAAVLYEEAERASAKQIGPSAIILGAALMLPSKPRGMGLDDGSLVSLLGHGTLRDSLEVFGGRQCHVVDAFSEHNGQRIRYATAWVDLERGALPIRLVMYDRMGKVNGESILSNVVRFSDQDGNKFWLPGLIEKIIHAEGGVLRTAYHIDVTRTKYNPSLTADELSIDFPPGTFIIDKVSGAEFRLPGSRTPDPRDLGFAQDTGRYPLAWIFFNVLLVVCLGVMVAIWRGRRPRRSTGG